MSAVAAAPPDRSNPIDWSITRDDRLLVVRFARPMQVASWAVWNGGRRSAPAVAWVGVKNAELPVGLDPRTLCGDRLQAVGLGGAVGLMTSGQLDRFRSAEASAAGLTARAVATVGLSNALRVGDSPGPLAPVGTINLLCAVSAPLSEEAALEAMSVAVEARTAAVLDSGVPSRRSGGPASGTGTDCVVLAWPEAGPGQAPVGFAGKHTALGHIVGRSVLACVRDGVEGWLEASGCRRG